MKYRLESPGAAQPLGGALRGETGRSRKAAQIKRLKELYVFLHPETKHGAVGKHRPKSQSSQIANSEDAESAVRFAKVEAANTGRDESTIKRAAARGEKLGVDRESGTFNFKWR
jgi:hypothetical protein